MKPAFRTDARTAARNADRQIARHPPRWAGALLVCISAQVLAQAAWGQTSAVGTVAGSTSAAATSAVATVLAQARAIVEASPAGGVRLIDADRELRDMLQKTVDDIRDLRFEKAVEALHTLITSDKTVFYPRRDDSRRHISSGQAADQLLGLLPKDAQALYNRMYGPAAQRLFEQAKAEANEPLLWRTARQYFHTAAGARAADMAAALASDRGAFLEAAQTWESICLEHSLTDLDRPMLLAKAATAYHLARCPPRAAAILNLLNSQYPRARGAIAGQETDLAAFVTRALAGKPATVPSPTPVAAWLSPYGAADAAAVMRECAASPFALWREPEGRRMTNAMELLRLTAGGAAERDPVWIGAAIEGGRVRAVVHSPGQKPYAIEIPATTHPVVFKDLIVCRREQAIVATSMATGNEAWRVSDLPLYRRVPGGKTLNHYLPLAGDMGRYTLSAADDRLFAVGNFRRIDPDTYRRSTGTPAEESSTLAAVSLADRKILWHVGNGDGQDEVIRNAKYLTAPAYHDGRLFVFAKLGNRYLTICLDAVTGKGLWNMPIGPIPTHTGEQLSWQAAYTMELMTERASLPSVAAGRVYFTSNSGLVGALDEHTGLPAWAYRYDSNLSGAADAAAVKDVAHLAFLISAARKPFPPQNPVVVVNGRVICLPCDSEWLLALNAVTGELMWKCERRGYQDLSYVDEDRVLLSGPGFRFISVADGRELKLIDAQIADRPAITPRAAIACGAGRLVQVDLQDYSMQEQTASDPHAMLGRLVTLGDRLVAANAAGVSVFFGFEEAWAALTKQIEQEREPAKKADAQFQRGMLALQTGRHEAALRDLRAAYADARRAGDAETTGRVQSTLYRTLLSGATAGAAKDEDAGRLLDEALQCADDPRRAVGVLIEQIRHHERFGRFGKSAEIAQSIADKYADIWIPSRDGSPGGNQFGYTFGHMEIERLIRTHGRSAYAAFDQRFGTAFEQAKRQSDVAAMLTAQRQWPRAESAPELLFTAAEELYRQALSNAPAARPLAGRASRVLGEIRNYPGSPILATAKAAQALIDSRFRTGLRHVRIEEMKSLPADLAVKFADFQGTVHDILQRLERIAVSLPAPSESFAALTGPVSPVTLFPETRLAVLRDASGYPVMAGERVFLHDEGKLVCFDTQANDHGGGRLWSVPLSPQQEPGVRTGYLSGDGRLLGVTDPKSIVIVDTQSGRETLRKDLNSVGIGMCARATGDGNRIVLADRGGQLACLNMVTGAKEWDWPFRGLLTHTLQAASDVVYGSDWGQENAIFLDIRSGRELHRFRSGRNGMVTAMNCDGFGAAVYVHKSIEFVDPRRPGRGPLKKAPIENPNQDILGFGRRFLVLRDRALPNVLRFMDLASQSQTNALELAVRGEQQRPMPVSQFALADGEGYAVCGMSSNFQEAVKLPVLVAIDLASAKELWRVPLHKGEERGASVSLPQLFGNALSVVVSPAGSEALPSRWLVFNARSGSPLMDFPARQSDPKGMSPGGRASRWAGSPTVLNGRAIIEVNDGILCLRSPL